MFLFKPNHNGTIDKTNDDNNSVGGRQVPHGVKMSVLYYEKFLYVSPIPVNLTPCPTNIFA